jgi:hypothetical protein
MERCALLEQLSRKSRFHQQMPQKSGCGKSHQIGNEIALVLTRLANFRRKPEVNRHTGPEGGM